MKRLVVSLYVAGCLGMVPGTAAAGQYLPDQERVVVSGTSRKIAWMLFIDPDCRATGLPSVGLIDPPKLGKVTTQQGQEYPSYNTLNPRSRCNTRKVPATQIIYTTAPGSVGEDTFAIELIGPLGTPMRQRFHVQVR